MSSLINFNFFAIILIINFFNTNNINQSNIIKIPLKNETETEYEILPNYIYQFNVENEKYLYYFQKEYKELLYFCNDDNIVKMQKDELIFKQGETIIVKYTSNLNNSTKIKVFAFPLYNELNSIETLISNETFFIQTLEDSVAFFDSLDNNAKIYCNITNEIVNTYGNFFEMKKSNIYRIDIIIYNISVIRKYVCPKSINGEINIVNDQKVFMYLSNNQSNNYIFNFKENTINKIIKLSEKTPESIVNIYSEDGDKIITLDKNSKYYLLNESFNGKLNFEIKENSAFIEFLSKGKAEILDSISKKNYLIKGNSVNIRLNKTQKSFKIKLKSNITIKLSVSFTISNNINYFYISKENTIIDTGKKEILLEYLAPFKYIEPLNDEFLSIYIYLYRKDNIIGLSYESFSEIDELIDLNISKDECEGIINYLSNIFELYVFNDIAKNPPKIYDNYHHEKINLIEKIKNVETNSRNFYEFYQEVLKIVTSTRDQHLSFSFTKINTLYLDYEVYLPFNFKIDEFEGEKRIFIEKNYNYFSKFDISIQNFIESHLNVPIKTINNIDPFDYIQNWSLFSSRKNPHSQFTYIIDKISHFYISNEPLYYWNISLNDYEFEDNTNLRLSYKLSRQYSKDKDNDLKNYITTNDKNNLIFNENLITDETKENPKNENGVSSKRKLINSHYINWKIEYEEEGKYLKCINDEDNRVNVLIQNSFNYDLNQAIPIIFECAQLFHENEYPIIIIESKNKGGNSKLALLMVQLFRIREEVRVYSSYRLSDYASVFYQNETFSYIDPETCDEINSFKDFKPDIDYYNYSGLNIEHKRTKPFIQYFSKSEREAINKFREDFTRYNEPKRPTDIIIFTDSYSFDAASTLIEGFNNIGGAIIVGYFGNPKIEGVDIFAASQSDSGVRYINGIKIGKMEFDVSFTETETFNDLNSKGNSIPREYELNPVDERVDIYEEYSDDIYYKFIDEALNIHNKYNNEEKCNSNNTKLFFYNEDDCFDFSYDKNAYGGYKCGDNNTWDKTKCFPYYCEIGFYFDLNQQKCFEECKSDIKSFYLNEKQYSNEYTIRKNDTYEFFTVNTKIDYIFDFSENNDDILLNNQKVPRISGIDGFYNRIIINQKKKFINDIKLKITSWEHYGDIINIRSDNYIQNKNYLKNNKGLMLIIQVSKEHILSINNKLNDHIEIAKYESGMNYDDIFYTHNSKYYKYCTYDMSVLEKDQLYFIFIYQGSYKNEYVYWFLENLNNDIITLKKYWQNSFYAKKDKSYHLDFKNMNMIAIMKLSKKTSNSEVIINDNGNEYKLNSKDYYYGIKGKDVNIKITKEDAIIDILYKIPEGSKVKLEFTKNKKLILNKKYNLINIPKNYSTELIQFSISDRYSSASYRVSHVSSFLQYNCFPPLEETKIIYDNDYYFEVFGPYRNKSEFWDEEYYTIMIILEKGELELEINANDKESDTDNKKDTKEPLSKGAIAGIIIGCLGFLIIFAFVLRCILKKYACCKKDLDNSDVENINAEKLI